MREAAIEEIIRAAGRARYASNTLLTASKLAKKGKNKEALDRLHTALSVLGTATEAASEACITLEHLRRS